MGLFIFIRLQSNTTKDDKIRLLDGCKNTNRFICENFR